MKSKILLAPDKFKGSISGLEFCNILKQEILSKIPKADVVVCPQADGGDGSLDILATYLDVEIRTCDTVDPLGRQINAIYCTSDKVAYIELASASGLVLLDNTEQNPMHTSTYGTGLQILDAINHGIEHIYLFLGGSATNDGGIGIASALGYSFLDKEDNVLRPIGSSLNAIAKIIPPNNPVNINRITLCCDVENIPFGEDGAAQVYAKQKGSNPEEIKKLDLGMVNYCRLMKEYNAMDLSQLIGGGAAGGVAVSLIGFFNAEIISGMKIISKISNLESKITSSDIVISGEGRLDRQSLSGKVVSGVADLCRKYEKRLWLIVGENDLSKAEVNELGVEKVFSILDTASDLEDAIANGAKYVQEISEMITDELKKLA